MKRILTLAAVIISIAGEGCRQVTNPGSKSSQQTFEIQKADSEWRKILSRQAYEVMVNGGTEAPFNNPYNNNHQKGIYVSAATGEPLFSSEDKFDSGTGWPSFTKPINVHAVTIVTEYRLGMEINEVVETKSGLHLGHVFNDGPADKGGKRYCMNSAALRFVKK